MKNHLAYNTLKKEAEGLYKEKGSRFIAYACKVENEDDIKEKLEALRKQYHDARHHCYAWILGREETRERSNDDGEPSGTAGKPILGQIHSRELTNTLVVVVRYFGGTLLGSSGLVRAYKTAAADALDNSVTERIELKESLKLEFPYPELNSVLKILKEENIALGEHSYEMECTIIADIPVRILEKTKNRLEKLRTVIINTVAGREDVP